MINYLYEITSELRDVVGDGYSNLDVIGRDLMPELRRLAKRRSDLLPTCERIAAAHVAAPRLPLSAFSLRDICSRMFAWAIPTPPTVSLLGSLGTLVEIGAGTGYWAAQAAAAGATVHAFDDGSWKMMHPTWHAVQTGGPEVLDSLDAPALLLCWPPYNDDMAFNALQKFRGETVVYVGEGHGGCTANDAFHDLLGAEWVLDEMQQSVSSLCWPGIRDRVEVYRRGGRRRRPATIAAARKRVKQLGLGRFEELGDEEVL